MEKQTRLGKGKVKYSYGPYNKIKDDEQWIRLTEGCPNNCPYCYEPQQFKVFDIPEIVKSKVKFMDMNLLCKPEAYNIIYFLPSHINKKKIEYELICGIDYRFLTQKLSNCLKIKNFKRPRIAWDWEFKEQYKIKDAIRMLTRAGYNSKNITIFMICNWKMSYETNMKKLDLCKVWNVKVADCWYDNQTSPNIQPIHWTDKQIKDFRKKVRKHNQLVNFGIDPEIKMS